MSEVSIAFARISWHQFDPQIRNSTESMTAVPSAFRETQIYLSPDVGTNPCVTYYVVSSAERRKSRLYRFIYPMLRAIVKGLNGPKRRERNA
jgi:hypothetical protein